MKPQMTTKPAQVHSIHIQLDSFPAHFVWIGPGLGVGRVLFHAEHADVALAAAGCFAYSILSFGSLAFWTFDHAYILPNF